MLEGQETELGTIEFRQLDVEFDLVTASDPSLRGLRHLQSDEHSRLIAIDNKTGMLYFALESAIGWTDISSALKERSVDGCTFGLDDGEQVVQLACSNDSLFVATTKRLLKLSVEGGAARIVVEREMAVKQFVVANARIYALLPSLTISTIDLTTLVPIEDNAFKGKCTAICTDTHKVFVATAEGAIKDSQGEEYGSIYGIDALHCASNGVLVAAKDRDMFVRHSGAWTCFTNPTRASTSGILDIETISDWHPELPLLIIASHSSSPEFAVLGIVNDAPFLFVLGIEDALPQFPLSSLDPDRDCCPVSVALDFTNAQSTTTSDEAILPPMPLVWSLTTDGTLVPFRIVRRGTDETRMYSKMSPLKGGPPVEEEEVEERSTSTPSSMQKASSIQVVENILLEAPKKKEPDATPITMDLGGIQNLIVQEFMKIHGWMERDLHRLRTLANENKELARQVQEEMLRLLKTLSMEEDHRGVVEENLMLAEEFGKLDDAWLGRVQRASKELHLIHSRLQALLNASTGNNLESGIESLSLDDVTAIKPLDPHSSTLADVQTRLEQLKLATKRMQARLAPPRTNHIPRDAGHAPIGYMSRDSRELLKAKLLRRPAKFTVISETAPPSIAQPIQREYPDNLAAIRKVLNARNRIALERVQPEVTVVAEAPSKQDTSIFKFASPALKFPPEQIKKEQGLETVSTKSAPSNELFAVKKTVEERPASVKFGFALPSVEQAPSIKSSEADSRAPLLPPTSKPIFSFAPQPSPSSALSLSLESTTLKSSGTTEQASTEPAVESESKSPIAETRMAEPPIPKLFAMIRKREEAHKGAPTAEPETERAAPEVTEQTASADQRIASEEESRPVEPEPSPDITTMDQPTPQTRQPHPTDDAIALESPLETLGRPLEDKGMVRTIFGAVQAKQDALQPVAPPTNYASPFGGQQFTFGSSFGQQASTAQADAPPAFAQPAFGVPSPSTQPAFGQHSFGKSSFASFGAFTVPQPSQGGGFASYSTTTNAFANLAQQASHKQPEEEGQGEKKKPSASLPSSFTTFRE